MFVIYENSTKNDKPLKRLFKFKEGTLVHNGKFKIKIDDSAPKYLPLSVPTKGKVYASQHPIEICESDGKVIWKGEE
ncbi:hypothetical protein VP14_205 [Vibrio phage VPMCC14]|nr:hypothetical protein VP14_205 [Vibrio phage VPMCC14]